MESLHSPEETSSDETGTETEPGAEKRKVSLTILTNSELQAFRDCGYKWGLSYPRGLRPKVAPRALAFGSAVHSGLEAICRTMGSPDLVGLPTAELVDRLGPISDVAISRAFGEWYKARLAQGLDDEALMAMAEEAEETQRTARWMARRYIDRNHLDWDNLVALAVEMPFKVPLRDRLGRASPHFAWAGVIDLVAYDRNVDDIVVYDHKTTKGAVDSVDRRVELDPQMAGYLHAVRELLRAFPAGWKIPNHGAVMLATEALQRASRGEIGTGRVTYNVLRKKAPSEPKVNKDGSVSVAAVDTTPEMYAAALAAQEERGKPITPAHAEVLSKLAGRGDTFLGRREFYRSDDEVTRWMHETFVDARRLREAERDDTARTRNPGNCTMPWSMQCTYRSVCLDPDAPEHLEHFEVRPRHQEVRAAEQRTETETEDDDA